MSAPKAMNTRLACVVITYNRDDFIETCIASLLEARSDTLDVSVTVINNGSPDNTAEVLARYAPEDVTTITNETNIPLTLSLNKGLAHAHGTDADYFILLNDDIEMKPGALAEMVAVCAEVEGSIVTPLQIDYRNPDRLDGGMMQKVAATPELLNDAVYRGEIKRYYSQHGMIGAAILAARETFAKVGDFDPLFPFYGNDDDYFNRARRLGVPLLLASKAHMLHMHGRVTAYKSKSQDRAEFLRRWRMNYRGQQLHKLKSPDRSLAGNYIRVAWRTAQNLPKFTRLHGLSGAGVALGTLFELLGSYGPVREARAAEAARHAAQSA